MKSETVLYEINSKLIFSLLNGAHGVLNAGSSCIPL